MWIEDMIFQNINTPIIGTFAEGYYDNIIQERKEKSKLLAQAIREEIERRIPKEMELNEYAGVVDEMRHDFGRNDIARGFNSCLSQLRQSLLEEEK